MGVKLNIGGTWKTGRSTGSSTTEKIKVKGRFYDA